MAPDPDLSAKLAEQFRLGEGVSVETRPDGTSRVVIDVSKEIAQRTADQLEAEQNKTISLIDYLKAYSVEVATADELQRADKSWKPGDWFYYWRGDIACIAYVNKSGTLMKVEFPFYGKPGENMKKFAGFDNVPMIKELIDGKNKELGHWGIESVLKDHWLNPEKEIKLDIDSGLRINVVSRLEEDVHNFRRNAERTRIEL